MTTIHAVAVSGSLGVPSRSSLLAELVLSAITDLIDARTSLIEIAQVGPLLGHGLNREGLPAPARAALELVERAQLLVVATPVYRGSYAGLFKHFFDLVEHSALVDVPVVLAANGGSTRHALMLEHALRPLFACFRAQPVPTALFATSEQLGSREVVSSELRQRIDLAARQAVRLLSLVQPVRRAAPELTALETPFDRTYEAP